MKISQYCEFRSRRNEAIWGIILAENLITPLNTKDSQCSEKLQSLPSHILDGGEDIVSHHPLLCYSGNEEFARHYVPTLSYQPSTEKRNTSLYLASFGSQQS